MLLHDSFRFWLEILGNKLLDLWISCHDLLGWHKLETYWFLYKSKTEVTIGTFHKVCLQFKIRWKLVFCSAIVPLIKFKPKFWRRANWVVIDFVTLGLFCHISLHEFISSTGMHFHPSNLLLQYQNLISPYVTCLATARLSLIACII